MRQPSNDFADRSLRPPEPDGGVLVEPPWETVGELVAANTASFAPPDAPGEAAWLSALRPTARRELLSAAHAYTSAYRDAPRPNPGAERLIFLAGHQPQLFHPGVWLKQFALGALARRHGAVAINLVIDGDEALPPVLAVPAGSIDQPRRETIPYDRAAESMAYEERRVVDRERFVGFGRVVAERIRPLVREPLIQTYWPLVVARLSEEDRLGACLAQARHQLEGLWGLDTLELPQSRVCDLPSFQRFMLMLLSRLPAFHAVYNRALGEYRRERRIRGAARPVPDLARPDDWLESPCGAWTADDPRRRRLFARRVGGELWLGDETGRRWALPDDERTGRNGSPEVFDALRREGVKIRSRALVTTLWARLVLGDLFVHGIGGAKYDRVTDRIIREFFGVAPPGFLVVSGTLRLPIELPPVDKDEPRRLRQAMRELTYHPERFLDPAHCDGAPAKAEAAALVAEKARWICAAPTREDARGRCRAIRRINAALQPWVAGQRAELERREGELLGAIRARAVFGWREYAFCLHPERRLREFLGGLLPGADGI